MCVCVCVCVYLRAAALAPHLSSISICHVCLQPPESVGEAAYHASDMRIFRSEETSKLCNAVRRTGLTYESTNILLQRNRALINLARKRKPRGLQQVAPEG